MTSEDIRSELEKNPFVPLRFHLVSGKTIDVKVSYAAWMLQNAVMILQDPRIERERAGHYDIVSLRNIERIEQL